MRFLFPNRNSFRLAGAGTMLLLSLALQPARAQEGTNVNADAVGGGSAMAREVYDMFHTLPRTEVAQAAATSSSPVAATAAVTSTPLAQPTPSPAAPAVPAKEQQTAATPQQGEIHSVPNPSPQPAASPAAASYPDVSQTPAIKPEDEPPADAAGDAALAQLAEKNPASPSQSVVVNLIKRLVQKGILSQGEAAEMIHQAEDDAQAAQAQAAATQEALNQAAAAQAAVAQSVPSSDDAVRVTYVPEVVKAQMREQIKEDVMEQARLERWAAPRLMPAWASKIHPFADIRVRAEGDFFPSGNDNTGAFPNFNAINTGAPFDVSGNQFSPQLNVDQDRTRFRLRARFGADITLDDHYSMGIRLATGDSNSPVSTNQSMGLPYQGQGGNFSKYAIWLDRAFIRYQMTGDPNKDVMLEVGRFDNPFFTVSQIIWDDDIGFDGAALQARYEVVKGFTPFINGGAFPVYNTDFNYATYQPAKYKSYDKYLFAGQIGFNWKISKDFAFTFGAAYNYFYNTEGKLSSPFTPLTANDAGDTDASRPSFAQKGNTYMALRNIVPDAANNYGTIDQYQYYGLATQFQEIDLTARLDYLRFEPIRVSLSGEFVKNLAFNSGDIGAKAVNNRGPNDDSLSNDVGPYVGGDTAWIVQLDAGSPKFEKRWDWNVGISYRYVESDSVIDGFCDSDFGGGGTNLKGYSIGGNLALSANVWVGLRWMSAQSIAGPTYKADVLQFDINSKF